MPASAPSPRHSMPRRHFRLPKQNRLFFCPQKKAATEKRDAGKKITLSRSLRPFAAPPPHLCPDSSRPRNMKQPLKIRARLPSLPILHHPSAKRCADKFFSLAKEPFFKKLFLFLAARPFPKTICNRLFSRFRRTFSFFRCKRFFEGRTLFFSQFFYLSFFYSPCPPRPPFSACVQRKNSVPEPSFCFIPGFAISARGNFLPSPSASPQIRHIFHDNKQKFSTLRPEKCAHLLHPKLLIPSTRWSPRPIGRLRRTPSPEGRRYFFECAPFFNLRRLRFTGSAPNLQTATINPRPFGSVSLPRNPSAVHGRQRQIIPNPTAQRYLLFRIFFLPSVHIRP